MKFFTPIVRLFLLTLWVPSSKADISLTLTKNNQYLPPPIQELPINEENLNTQPQQNYEENSSGNPRYHTFEVHNHYETPKDANEINSESLERQITFANNNYKNPGENIRIDNPNLAVSYLSFMSENDGSPKQIIVQHQTKNNVSVPFSSNFRQTFPEKAHRESNVQSAPQLFNNPKAVDQQYFSQPVERSLTDQEYQIIQPQDHFSNFENSFSIAVSSSYQIANNNQYTIKGPNYLPPKQQSFANIGPAYSLPQHQGRGFKGPDYLPPQTNFKAASTQEPQNKQFSSNEQFKGSEYLPPKHSQELEQNSLSKSFHRLQPYHQTTYSNNPFKGTDYLPPHQSQSTTPFKGPDYLPPVRNQLQSNQQQVQNLPTGYDFEIPPNAEDAIEELHRLPEESTGSQITDTENDETSKKNYGAVKPEDFSYNNQKSDYAFRKTENTEQAIKLLHSSIQSTKDTIRSLPVYNFQRISNIQNIENQLQIASFQRQSGSESDGVTTGYDFQKPDNSDQSINTLQSRQESGNIPAYQTEADDQSSNFPVQQQLSHSSFQTFKGSDYLPPSKRTQQFKGTEFSQSYLRSETFKAADYLPPSQEFATSSKAAFTGPKYLPPSSSFLTYKGPDNVPSLNAQRTEISGIKPKALEVFKGHDYLPPKYNQPSYQKTAGNQFKGPDYLPPTESIRTDAENQFKRPEYLPPTELKTVVMYPLSSFMATIKPNERYGNRRPFAEYGLPLPKITFPNSIDIAPMYRQPTPKPQYYAPSMSYTSNAFNSQTATTYTSAQHQTVSTLSQQARQALQAFMPAEILQTTPTSHIHSPESAFKPTAILQAIKPAKAKIHTVQIVKPNVVKTFKVLESLDDAGVKTLKILGSSNKSPMGDHRVVKVVSGSHEQSVHTVKIFNDHQDVTTSDNNGPTDQKSSNYLPPKRTKRNPTIRPKS